MHVARRFGWKDDGTFDADNPRDEETGELIGVDTHQALNVSITVDTRSSGSSAKCSISSKGSLLQTKA